MRIVIVGTSCAGKTTLGGQLSKQLGIPYTDLDDLHWNPGWIETPFEEFVQKVQAVTSQEKWIISGNYSKVRDSIWTQATHLIWLNYSFPVVMTRALKRTFKRSLTGELICNGNIETLSKAFLTRDSILWWVIKTYQRRKREIKKTLESGKYNHLKVSELQSFKDSKKMISELSR